MRAAGRELIDAGIALTARGLGLVLEAAELERRALEAAIARRDLREARAWLGPRVEEVESAA